MELKYKVGDILEVKKEFRGSQCPCGNFENSVDAKYIKITKTDDSYGYEYQILNSNRDDIGCCACCFKDEHLESIEQIISRNDFKIGDILKVKENSRTHCNSFYSNNGAYVKITKVTKIVGKTRYHYDILNENKEKIDYCFNCFNNEDLEYLPSESVILNKSVEELVNIIIKNEDIFDIGWSDYLTFGDTKAKMYLSEERNYFSFEITLGRVDYSFTMKDGNNQLNPEIESFFKNYLNTYVSTLMPQVTELTLEDIANKFGVNVKDIKIKK